MTAKHRKGKSNHKQDDNFFKNEVMETEQHQTLSYLTDNLMGVQVKIGRLQTYHEEMRLSKSKEHVPESIETRLAALEESYTLTQKQVGIALAAAEQLKTSDLPTQVLSLHTEMKARLAEVQQATVSVEQLGRLQSMLKEKSEEFEVVRTQVEDLATHNGELSQKVEALTGSLGETDSMLEGEIDQIANLGATLDGQATEVLGLKDKLHEYQTQLEASILEMATVRELIKNERSRQLQQASVGEELNTLEEETQPPAEPLELREEDTTVATGEGEAEDPAPATGEDEVDAVSEEEEEAPTNENEEAETVEEEAGEAATEVAVETEQSAPVGQEAASSQESTEADEDEEAAAIEQEPSKAQEPIPEEEDVDAAPTEGEEQTVEEENKEAGDAEVEEESAAEEEDDDDESEDVMESEGEEEQGNQEEEGKQDKAVEKTIRTRHHNENFLQA
ncbi:unnamed protein product [Menidia menidia]|uniref:(Atlantic silverside) hypothetical protein n=1 Tax=Menidia menidia TaxID=238744 RepID=A0A8S4BZU6_9TELE|nr:unnamed protein product [Menidia menidia]